MPKNAIVLGFVSLGCICGGAGFCLARLATGDWSLLVGVGFLLAAIVTGLLAFYFTLRYDGKARVEEKDPPKAH